MLGREFTQHIIKICLPPELYMAVTQFQVNKKIGKCYAGLLLITKAAYQELLIGKEDYEKFVFRYSRRIVPEEQPKQLSPEQLNEQKKIEATARSFANVLDQWELHLDPKWSKTGYRKLRNGKTKYLEQKQSCEKQTHRQLDYILKLDSSKVDGFPSVIFPQQDSFSLSAVCEMKFYAVKKSETGTIQCWHFKNITFFNLLARSHTYAILELSHSFSA
jgi:hypothetical protein